MDTRSLIALGMLLSLVAMALAKGAVQPQDVKEIVLFLGGGIIGFTVPKRTEPEQKPAKPAPVPPAVVVLLVGSLLLLYGCGTAPPMASWDRCTTGRVIDACNPADHPPLALDRRTWPFPHIEEEPPQPQTEDTPASRLLKKLGK